MTNDQHIAFTATDVEGAELRDLARTLTALGLEVELEKRPRGRVRVSIGYPMEHEARQQRTRRAGRNPTYNRFSSPVFKSDTTAAEALAWLDGHSAAEGMAALACSRSSYFRRKNIIKKAVEQRRTEDKKRKAAGRDPFPPLLLGDVLSRKGHN